MLTRQDSALWLLVLGLEVWRRNGKLAWRETIVALLLTLPWFVYASLRYGSPIPNSAAAKIGQLNTMAAGNELAFWQQFWFMFTRGLHSIFIILFLAAIVFGLWTIVRYPREFGWMILWTVLYIST